MESDNVSLVRKNGLKFLVFSLFMVTTHALQSSPYVTDQTVTGRCTDTSDLRHFGPKTFRHYVFGAEVSIGYLGISADKLRIVQFAAVDDSQLSWCCC